MKTVLVTNTKSKPFQSLTISSPDDTFVSAEQFSDFESLIDFCIDEQAMIAVFPEDLKGLSFAIRHAYDYFSCDPRVYAVTCETSSDLKYNLRHDRSASRGSFMLSPLPLSNVVFYSWKALDLVRYSLTDAGSDYWQLFPSVNQALSDIGYTTVHCTELIALTGQAYSSSVVTNYDASFVSHELGKSMELELEILKARGNAFRKGSALVDARDLHHFFSGTSDSLVTLIKTLPELKPAFDYDIVCPKKSFEFHFPDTDPSTLNVIFEIPDKKYEIWFKPSQPWSVGELKFAALRSSRLFYLLQDTIGWDCFYIRSERVPSSDSCWKLLPHVADGIAFFSDYSKDLFSYRFDPMNISPKCVSLLPFPESPTSVELVPQKNEKKNVFIVGNDYAHKMIEPTIRALMSSNFSNEIQIIAIGGNSTARNENVRRIPSGNIPEAEMEALYQNADVVIFPSAYEGFGLPFVRAASLGKPLVAWNSSLNGQELRKKYSSTAPIYLSNSWSEFIKNVNFALNNAKPIANALINNRSAKDYWTDIFDFIVHTNAAAPSRISSRLKLFGAIND